MHEQLRKSITTLIFVLSLPLVFAAYAQAPRTSLSFKADAPDRYVVVPGDTLWGIAQRYTDSPWRWSELWNLNKDDIKNPHRIYPGDVIVLDRAKGRLAVDPAQNAVKLSPSVRSQPIVRQAIPSIPSGAIEPFLSRPLVVEPDELDKAPFIVGTEENRVILAAGNTAYVRGMGDSKETTWYIYRRGKALVDPDTNRTLGYEANYLGTAEVSQPGEPTAVRLLSVAQEIVMGDKLVPAGKPELISYAPRPPSGQVNGRIMSIYGGVYLGEGGQQSIITINRGRADGLDVGTVVGLYGAGTPVVDSTKTKGSPEAIIKVAEQRYGVAFVFRSFDRVSYALVMRITRPVRALDAVRNP